jgi:hypothetical protein
MLHGAGSGRDDAGGSGRGHAGRRTATPPEAPPR